MNQDCLRAVNRWPFQRFAAPGEVQSALDPKPVDAFHPLLDRLEVVEALPEEGDVDTSCASGFVRSAVGFSMLSKDSRRRRPSQQFKA